MFNKSAERFEQELRFVFKATPSRSLSIFDVKELLANEEAMTVMKKVYGEFRVGK